MNPELKRAAQIAADYIESFDHHKVSEEVRPAALRARLQKELTADGLPPLQVINELAEDAEAGLLNTAGGRFFGWVIGGGIPVSYRGRLADLRLGPECRCLCLFAISCGDRRGCRWLVERHIGLAATGIVCLCYRLPDGACHRTGGSPP